MNSQEKVLLFLEQLQEEKDEAIAEAVALPIPPYMLRMALATVPSILPEDPAELDDSLARMSAFCLSLRSDPVEENAPAAPA